jgi:hypothetical protein
MTLKEKNVFIDEIIEKIETFELESHKTRNMTLREQVLHFSGYDCAIQDIKNLIKE